MQMHRTCKTRNLAAALALALLLFAASARADDVAFTHVTVVDVVEGRGGRLSGLQIAVELLEKIKKAVVHERHSRKRAP